MELTRLAGPFQLLWTRITFSRLTLIYFVFSILHFAIQHAFQMKAYTINANAQHGIDQIIQVAGTINASVPFLRGSRLYLCSWIPSNLNTDVADCPVIWNGDEGDTTRNVTISPSSVQPTVTITTTIVTSSSRPPVQSPTSPSESESFVKEISSLRANASDLARDAAHPRSIFRRAVDVTPSQAEKFPVLVSDVNGAQAIEPSEQCLWALNWPNVFLRNTKREDSVFIAFQFWVLAVSIVALLNESIPHILASLLTHMMATAWCAFQIIHTANFRADFKRVITEGACKQMILNANYWSTRRLAEILSLCFNVLALIISCALTLKLIKVFGWQTFKRVGASLKINRIYKLVLSLSITIQLSLFFMVVTVALWIDQLTNGGIGDLASFVTLYKATSFVTIVLLIPWLMTGWFAVRRELHVPMFIFLFLSILYLAGWGVMFFSTTFRWTFTTWCFFSVMASASVFLTLMAMILGIICRYNFGKGLTYYLNTNQLLSEENASMENVAFAASEKPIPTFSFGKNEHGSSGSTVYFVTFPQSTLQRNSDDVEIHRSRSQTSSTSSSSYHSRNGSGQSNHTQKQRWIIE